MAQTDFEFLLVSFTAPASGDFPAVSEGDRRSHTRAHPGLGERTSRVSAVLGRTSMATTPQDKRPAAPFILWTQDQELPGCVKRSPKSLQFQATPQPGG